MSSVSEVTELQELLEVIDQLPDTVNPYNFAINVLHSEITPTGPDFFIPMLYVCIALAVVGLLLGLSSLIFKSRYSALWVMRKRHTPMGSVITTNTTTLLAILNCIHFTAAIVAEVFIIRTFKYGKTPLPWQVLQPVLWLPVALSSWTETSGTALASLLSRTGRSSRSKSMLNRLQGKSQDSFWKAWQVNLITSLGYIAVPIACIPIFGLGCAKMQAAWNDLQRLESLITPAAAAWQQGDNFQMDSSLLPLLSRYEEHGNQALILIGKGFIVLVVLLVTAGVVYVPSVWIYVRMLHRQLHSYVNSQTGSLTAAAEERHRRTRLTHLRNTYQLMIAESIIVLTLNIAFFFLGGTVGIFPKTIIGNGHNLAVFYTIAFLAYGVTGVLLNGILAFRSVQPLLVRSSSGPKNFAEAIAVETVVQRFMDGEASEEHEDSAKIELNGRRQDVLSFEAASIGPELDQKMLIEKEKSDHPFTFSPSSPLAFDNSFQRPRAV